MTFGFTCKCHTSFLFELIKVIARGGYAGVMPIYLSIKALGMTIGMNDIAGDGI